MMKMAASYNYNCNKISKALYIFMTLFFFDIINVVTSNNELLSACEHLRQAEFRREKSLSGALSKSVRIPRCSKLGDFEAIQCSNELNGTECWCVDEYGVELLGTRQNNEKDVNCSKVDTSCSASSCRMYCPSGFARDLQSGCSICQCRDPCAGVECPGGLACQPQEVKCKNEPCPPVPTCKRARSLGDLCPVGQPLAIGETIRPFLCGVTPGKPTCPPLYQCLVKSSHDYGVCCPASLKIQKPGICPNANDIQSTESTGFICGNPCGHDLECPHMQKCCHSNGCGSNCIQPFNVTACHQAKMLSEILSVNEREGRGYIPQCDGPGGIFSVRQCSRNGLVCWCVDSQTGNKMKGSMGSANLVNCNEMDNSISRSNGRSFDSSNRCDQNICASICEYGFKIDHNGCSTCECAEPCEGFVCEKNFHCEVAKDPQCSSGSALCASEPICQPNIIYSNPCIIGTPLINNVTSEIFYCNQDETTDEAIKEITYFDSDDKIKGYLCPNDYKCTKMYSYTKSVCCPEPQETTVTPEKWNRPQTMCEYLRDFSEKMEGTEDGMSLAITSPKCESDGGYMAMQCKRKTIKVTKSVNKRLIEHQNIRQMKSMFLNEQQYQNRYRRNVDSEEIHNVKLFRIDDDDATQQHNVQMATSNVIDFLKHKLENPINNEEEMIISEIISSRLFDSSGLEGRHAKLISSSNLKLQDLKNSEQIKDNVFNNNKLKPVILNSESTTAKPEIMVDFEIEIDECWCVDGFGTEIPKTKSPNTTFETCENLRQSLECLDLTCRMGCDYGFLLDPETQCPQCECRDPCDSVECLDGEECRTVEVSCEGEYCPPVPACLPRKPGQCPFLVPPGNEGSNTDFCDYECRSDFHCEGDMRCCSNGCGTQCVSPQMKTACQHLQTIHLHQAVELGIPAKQKYIAQCDEKDGSWKSIQCGPDNVCWCVDTNGNEKSGTRTSRELTNCERISTVECPSYKCKPCDHGYLLDKNGCTSCECRDPCKEISCPGGESCELVQIECIDSPCQKMPICVPFRESVCTEGLPLKMNGREISCGPQNDIDNCPTTHTCSLDPMTNKGFCCQKTRDVCFESLDDNCINNYYKMDNYTAELVTKWKFSPRQNKCVSISMPFNISTLCQSKNLFHSESGCKSVCPVLSQCERLRLKNLLAAKRSGQTSVWFSPRCDTEGSWSPVQCLGEMEDNKVIGISMENTKKNNNINVCWCADKKGGPVKGSLTRGVEPKCNHRQARRRMYVEENVSDPVMEELIRQMTILSDNNDILNEDDQFETSNEKHVLVITTVTEKILNRVNNLEKNSSTTNNKLVATTTRCNALRATATFSVACNLNGSFVPTQCNTEVCWCVDAAGNQLPSSSPFKMNEAECSYTPIDLVEVEIYLNNPKKIPLKDVYDVLKQETRMLLGTNPVNLRVHENLDGNILLRFDLTDENKIDTAFALEEMVKQSNLSLYNNNLTPDITQSRFLHRNSNLLPIPQQAAGTAENTFHMIIFVLTTGSAFLISIFVVFIMLKRGKNKSKQYSNKTIGQGDKNLDYSSPIFVLSANEKKNCK